MGLVSTAVPSEKLRGETAELAYNLLESKPIASRAAKSGFGRCRELKWEQVP